MNNTFNLNDAKKRSKQYKFFFKSRIISALLLSLFTVFSRLALLQNDANTTFAITCLVIIPYTFSILLIMTTIPRKVFLGSVVHVNENKYDRWSYDIKTCTDDYYFNCYSIIVNLFKDEYEDKQLRRGDKIICIKPLIGTCFLASIKAS